VATGPRASVWLKPVAFPSEEADHAKHRLRSTDADFCRPGSSVQPLLSWPTCLRRHWGGHQGRTRSFRRLEVGIASIAAQVLAGSSHRDGPDSAGVKYLTLGRTMHSAAQEHPRGTREAQPVKGQSQPPRFGCMWAEVWSHEIQSPDETRLGNAKDAGMPTICGKSAPPRSTRSRNWPRSFDIRMRSTITARATNASFAPGRPA